MSLKKEKKWTAAIENNDTYLMYYNRLRDYALSMFKWEGLPDSINQRFLEVTMFEEGRCVFFEDKQLGFLTLPVTIGSPVNVYNEPTDYRAVAVNGYNKNLTPDDAVVIYNNYSRTSILPTVRAYAYRLYQVERARDVNVRAQRTPILILADETQRLTMQNAYMKYDGNEPFIFGNKSGFDKDAFKVLKTDAPFVTDKLMMYKHAIWNEAMSFLGINNSKQDKKERLVEAEVSANDEQVIGSRYVWLDARQDACKRINELFGLNVSVDFKLNQQQDTTVDPIQDEGDEE
jgi:hypothetical protein